MKLYEMLATTHYYQKTWIFENNACDQNMPLFKGMADDARKDDVIWDWLMCDVELYYCEYGTLVILVRDENYNERLEKHYLYSDRWGTEKEKRPWRTSSEIDMELKKQDEND